MVNVFESVKTNVLDFERSFVVDFLILKQNVLVVMLIDDEENGYGFDFVILRTSKNKRKKLGIKFLTKNR